LYTQPQRLQTNLSHISNVEMCYATFVSTIWAEVWKVFLAHRSSTLPACEPRLVAVR